MKRIVLTGPESSGKTTLAQRLAAHYRVPWVPEYAREYLNKLGRDYTEKDLLEIASGQIYRENRIGEGQPNLLICDTDLLTIKVWGDYKYGKTDSWILDQIALREYDHYFLCGIDIPWESDPQRENPGQREELFGIYKKELLQSKCSFSELIGTRDERLKNTIAFIDSLLK